jgi:hypothetical protein
MTVAFLFSDSCRPFTKYIDAEKRASSVVISKAVSTSHRTSYAMIRAGLKAYNGLSLSYQVRALAVDKYPWLCYIASESDNENRYNHEHG